MPKDTQNKDPYVLMAWSGGLDSTYMIQHYLDKGYKVDLLPIHILNNENKNKNEDITREKIYEQFYKNNNRVTLLDKSEFSAYYTPEVIFAQAPVWLTALSVNIRAYHTEAAVGYIMNDDAISFLKEFKKLWNSLLFNSKRK